MPRGDSDYEYRVTYRRPGWTRKQRKSRKFDRFSAAERYVESILAYGPAEINVDRAERGPWEPYQPTVAGPRFEV